MRQIRNIAGASGEHVQVAATVIEEVDEQGADEEGEMPGKFFSFLFVCSFGCLLFS